MMHCRYHRPNIPPSVWSLPSLSLNTLFPVASVNRPSNRVSQGWLVWEESKQQVHFLVGILFWGRNVNRPCGTKVHAHFVISSRLLTKTEGTRAGQGDDSQLTKSSVGPLHLAAVRTLDTCLTLHCVCVCVCGHPSRAIPGVARPVNQQLWSLPALCLRLVCV